MSSNAKMHSWYKWTEFISPSTTKIYDFDTNKNVSAASNGLYSFVFHLTNGNNGSDGGLLQSVLLIALHFLRMVASQMFGQATMWCIAFVTIHTWIWFLSGMRSHVFIHIERTLESSSTYITGIVFRVDMNSSMARQIARCREFPSTRFTLMRPNIEMDSHVHFEMEFAGKPTAANITREIFASGVRDDVPL